MKLSSNIFCIANGVKHKLEAFRGNRFNILFFNGAGAYFLHENALEYLVNADNNKLLKAVKQDLGVVSFIAGCKALGLVDKYLTGPLWRLLNKVDNICDMNKRLHCSSVPLKPKTHISWSGLPAQQTDTGYVGRSGVSWVLELQIYNF